MVSLGLEWKRPKKYQNAKNDSTTTFNFFYEKKNGSKNTWYWRNDKILRVLKNGHFAKVIIESRNGQKYFIRPVF